MSVSNREPVRHRLLEAAIRAFAERGYHKTRVSDIVGGAGVAQGTFYLYFDGKEAIFEQLVDGFFDRVLNETLGAHRDLDVENADEVRERVREAWRVVLHRCRRERELVALILRDATSLGPEFEARVQVNLRRVVDALAEGAERGMQRGLIRRVGPQLVGWVVLGMVERVVYHAIITDGVEDLDRLADELTLIELSGLLADGEGRV